MLLPMGANSRETFTYDGEEYSVPVMFETLDGEVWVLKGFDPDTGEVIYSRMGATDRHKITGYPKTKDMKD